jgi:glyceraldehyde 3-phosphate dehydrogenase
MATRIGINGYGQLGRAVARRCLDRIDLEIVAINDGLAALDWGALRADIVIESTGELCTREDAALHLKAGARKVVTSAPDTNADVTVVMRVNDSAYDPDEHDIISCATGATNCVAPMVMVLYDAFGIERGLMTSVQPWAYQLRPATAARTTGIVLPEVADRLDGVAVGVPVEDCSLTELTAILGQDVKVDEVNEAFREEAAGRLAGVLRYSTDPLVSRDIIGDPASCVFDSTLTQAAGPLVKVFGWYDDEWGHACRLVDVAVMVAARF